MLSQTHQKREIDWLIYWHWPKKTVYTAITLVTYDHWIFWNLMALLRRTTLERVLFVPYSKQADFITTEQCSHFYAMQKTLTHLSMFHTYCIFPETYCSCIYLLIPVFLKKILNLTCYFLYITLGVWEDTINPLFHKLNILSHFIHIQSSSQAPKHIKHTV